MKLIKTKHKGRFLKAENKDKSFKKEIKACEYCGILYWKDKSKRCKCKAI